MFEECDESCGWIAAVVAALAYGSFGVPIKETLHIDVHPLVLQSYKTLTMFSTCWFVVLMGENARWTPWGLLSGLLWVSGGAFGIYGIRLAGMATAVGTWASVMVAVNFFWGIIIFGEPIHNFWYTLVSFCLLALGLVGMSRYSAKSKETIALSTSLHDKNEHARPIRHEAPTSQPTCHHDYERQDDSIEMIVDEQVDEDHGKRTQVPGMALTRRQLGILGAFMNGILTGSSLIPLHYAKAQGFGGAAYMISFATGSLVANIGLWCLFYLYHLQSNESMPQWHVKQLWFPGFMAGLLLSIAMFGTILSVTYLGQGIGNSLVQSKIIISGLWGILWYKEIQGRSQILKWFASAGVAIIGILWLSHEHIVATRNGNV